MGKYPVLTSFVDNKSKKRYEIDSFFETDDQARAKELQDLRFIGLPEKEKNETSLLDLNANEAIAAITKELSETDLQTLLKAESEDKKRSTVIKHIENLIKGEDDGSGKA